MWRGLSKADAFWAWGPRRFAISLVRAEDIVASPQARDWG
jgi:hypothetical protein